MSTVQLVSFTMALMLIVVGLAYLLEIRNPFRSWLLTIVVLLPVAVFVALFIHRA
jgi:hypothetical protein